MIRIILPDKTIVVFMQITDYTKPKKTLTLKFEVIPKIGIVQRIRLFYRIKHKCKNHHSASKFRAKSHQNSLNLFSKGSKCPVNRHPLISKKNHKIPKYVQTTLNFEKKGRIRLKKGSKYTFIDRFASISATTCDDFCTPLGLSDEWVYYQEVPEFKGLFQHMILLNSFAYWDTVELEIRKDGFVPKGFSVKEFIIWEFLRHSSGIRFYTQFYDLAKPWDKSSLACVLENPENVPQPYHCSHMYSFLKARHFEEFFMRLVDESVKYGIILPRIVEADGVFVRSWAGNFSKDKNGDPTDPDATRTVHDGKRYGKGFTTIAFIAWCGNRWLPVWCKTYTGSVSENKIYSEVVDEFLKASPYKWEVIGYDMGADSKTNRAFNRENGLIGIIGARKNTKYEPLVEIKKGKFFLQSDIPKGMGPHKFGQLHDHRAQAEAEFSPLDLAFSMKRMNTMGQEAASIHIFKYFSLLQLHALTAYKVNRPDLIMNSKAFTKFIL